MKRNEINAAASFATAVVMFAAVFLPKLCGWELVVHHGVIPAVIFTVLFAGTSASLLRDTEPSTGAVRWMTALTLPLTCMDLLLSMWICRNVVVNLLHVVWVGCSIAVVLKYAQTKGGKILVGLLSGLFLTGWMFLALIWFTFGQIGQNTVVKTVASPEGTYRAEVVDVDQGALGGDTVVNVWEENRSVHLYFVEFSKMPQPVYRGSWGEFQDMEIHWESEQVLCINGTEYEVK